MEGRTRHPASPPSGGPWRAWDPFRNEASVSGARTMIRSNLESRLRTYLEKPGDVDGVNGQSPPRRIAIGWKETPQRGGDGAQESIRTGPDSRALGGIRKYTDMLMPPT